MLEDWTYLESGSVNEIDLELTRLIAEIAKSKIQNDEAVDRWHSQILALYEFSQKLSLKLISSQQELTLMGKLSNESYIKLTNSRAKRKKLTKENSELNIRIIELEEMLDEEIHDRLALINKINKN